VLRLQLPLFALAHVVDGPAGAPAEFRRADLLSSAQFEMATDALAGLLRELRPDAVGLADAWARPDSLLRSALGAADGRVYERLFQAASMEPLNGGAGGGAAADISTVAPATSPRIHHPDVDPVFMEVMSPLMAEARAALGAGVTPDGRLAPPATACRARL
jgi:hypothetical protein